MTNAEARFNKSLRPRKPEGSLGRTAQDVPLDSHTAPELCPPTDATVCAFYMQVDTVISCNGMKKVFCILYLLIFLINYKAARFFSFF